MPKIILKINKNDDNIFKNNDICCYIVDSRLESAKIKQVTATEKMVLVMGKDAESCYKKYNLDGVVVEIDPKLPVKKQLKPWREMLARKTLGAIIPPRRHEAMLASETEPEFVAFNTENPEEASELIDWYNELFLLPLAVWVKQKNIDITKINCDFVIIDAEKFENSGC